MSAAHTFVVTVVTDKAIPNLADKIAGRIWSIDGVDQSVEIPVHVTELPSDLSFNTELPAHLQREAEAVGASQYADRLEHGEVA